MATYKAIGEIDAEAYIDRIGSSKLIGCSLHRVAAVFLRLIYIESRYAVLAERVAIVDLRTEDPSVACLHEFGEAAAFGSTGLTHKHGFAGSGVVDNHLLVRVHKVADLGLTIVVVTPYADLKTFENRHEFSKVILELHVGHNLIVVVTLPSGILD